MSFHLFMTLISFSTIYSFQHRDLEHIQLDLYLNIPPHLFFFFQRSMHGTTAHCKGIYFSNFTSSWTLLLCRYTIDFSVLTIYPGTLLNSLISSNFLQTHWDFLSKQSCYLQTEARFISSFLIYRLFVSFSYPITLAKISIMTEVGRAVLFPSFLILGGKYPVFQL